MYISLESRVYFLFEKRFLSYRKSKPDIFFLKNAKMHQETLYFLKYSSSITQAILTERNWLTQIASIGVSIKKKRRASYTECTTFCKHNEQPEFLKLDQ